MQNNYVIVNNVGYIKNVKLKFNTGNLGMLFVVTIIKVGRELVQSYDQGIVSIWIWLIVMNHVKMKVNRYFISYIDKLLHTER